MRRLTTALILVAALVVPAGGAGAHPDDLFAGDTIFGTPQIADDGWVTLPGAQDEVWFGIRIFTTPETLLEEAIVEDVSEDGQLCYSNWGGNGSQTGGLFGQSQVPDLNETTKLAANSAVDSWNKMIGGATLAGCLKPGVKFNGKPDDVAYGAFWGRSKASWSGNVATATGNVQWWNLWGNFDHLAHQF